MRASAGAVAGDAIGVRIGIAPAATSRYRGATVDEDRPADAVGGAGECLDPRLTACAVAADAIGEVVAISAKSIGIDQRIAADREGCSCLRLQQRLAALAIATGAIVMVAALPLCVQRHVRQEVEAGGGRAKRIGPCRPAGAIAAAAS